MAHILTARELFPTWFTISANPGEAFWNATADLDDHNSVAGIIYGLGNNIGSFYTQSPETFTRFGAAVIADIHQIEQGVITSKAVTALAMFRFLTSAAALRHSVTHGRASLVYNWLLCSICDRPFEDIETGVPVEMINWQHRPAEFLQSNCVAISSVAYDITARWFADLYYAAWKYSLHHELAELMLGEARRIISSILTSATDPVIVDAVEAASQMAVWLNQAGKPEAKAIALVIANVYDRPGLMPAARKTAGMALSSEIGRHTTLSPAQWAARTLADCGSELIQHDEFQLLATSCVSPEEVYSRLPELLLSSDWLAGELASLYGPNPAAITFRRSQLFDIAAPPIRSLVSLGRCREAMHLVGAWFGVPADLRRSTSVLVVVPGHDEGVLYAVDGFARLYPRDTDAAMRQLIDAINTGFDLSIVVRHHREPAPVKAGRRPQAGRTDALAAATLDYYAIDSLHDFLCESPDIPAGSFHPHAELTPFQPLTEKELGLTWPIVTSFQEPQPDRPVRRAFLWSCGTILGDIEVAAVANYLQAHGVTCVVQAGAELTREEFLLIYRDPSFDIIWANAHGMFDPREPHLAYMKLSIDGTHIVTVSDMLEHPVSGPGRRLLMLNICLGGSVLVTASPACLGMGAMLSSANQAVVAHLVEVGSFVAPLFGALMAIGLQHTKAFFPAFRYAVAKLPGDHWVTMELLREHAPECEELIERLSSTRPGVEQEDVRTWGTPVFFE